MNRRVLILAALLVSVTGCASNEALFAEYDRACPVGMGPPSLATVVAVVSEAAPPRSPVEAAVFFEYRSASVDDAAAATLDAVVDRLAALPGAHLFLRAQTDARGSRAVNEALAQDRLESVRTGLLDRGVAPDLIRGVGIGEREAVEGASAADMAASRRVDIEFTDAHGRPLPVEPVSPEIAR